jgi:hypothetical protein
MRRLSVGTLRSGAFIETIDPLGELTLISERAGVGMYRVEVRKAGYRDWAAEDVRVHETGGHARRFRLSRCARPSSRFRDVPPNDVVQSTSALW